MFSKDKKQKKIRCDKENQQETLLYKNTKFIFIKKNKGSSETLREKLYILLIKKKEKKNYTKKGYNNNFVQNLWNTVFISLKQ